MNPAVARVALVIGGIAGAVFVAWLIFCALLYGCAPPPLPAEGPITCTVASSRDH